MDRFFSQCPDCGFETHATAEEAEATADAHLDHFRDEAGEGWSEEVTQICWGDIKGEVVQTERRPIDPEQDFGIDPECEEVWDFGVMPVAPEPPAPSDQAGYKVYPCGCSAAPAESVPNYCPTHGNLRALVLTALKGNGGPIASSDTIDGVPYVMVRESDFLALEAALKTK